MELKKTEPSPSPEYPPYHEGRRWLTTLVIGASITVAAALVSCGKKEGEPSTAKDKAAPGETTDTAPPADPGKSNPPPKPEVVDTDNDGVPDDKDMCKTVPGKKEWAGCPHSPFRTAGTPRPITRPQPLPLPSPAHTTNPGSQKDAPPMTQAKKPPKVKDSDGDGVPDNVDKCPTIKGRRPDGCPPRKMGVKPRPRPMK